MAIQLKPDEMLEAMSYEPEKFPELKMFTRLLETLAKAIADVLAQRLDIHHGRGTLQPGFAGLCVPFYAKRKNQPIPDHIQGLDEGGEPDWSTKAGELAGIKEYIASCREWDAKHKAKKNHAKKPAANTRRS